MVDDTNVYIITSSKLGKILYSEISCLVSLTSVLRHTFADLRFFTSLWLELTEPTVAYTGSFFVAVGFLEDVLVTLACPRTLSPEFAVFKVLGL